MKSARKVTIVGGGSTGWMAAAFLSRLPGIEVTLVESSDVPVIGVGESTNLTMRGFHQIVPGFDEREFMRASNATFKLAIRFENFRTMGHEFFHPFGGSHVKSADGLFCSDAQTLHKEFHIARKRNQFSGDTVHSYHIDAGLYAHYLKARCAKNGVTHIVDNIGEVKLDDKGNIASIATGRSGLLTADLFVDCTGFRSLLLDKSLSVPFVDASRYLLNDSAIAARVPYTDREAELHPYTNCRAMDAGWAWRIPLWNRFGAGYVYSSRFISKADAEAELVRHLGRSDLELNHIKIRVGRHDAPWFRNCVGLGLAYGFLEPLESTGLSLTQAAITDLAKALVSGASSVEREIFNRKQNDRFDRTRDFVLAHFVLSQREDTPYWRYVRYENPITDELANILAYARSESYAPLRSSHQFYSDYNWNLILSGMGFFDRALPEVRGPKLPKLVSHEAYLRANVYDDEPPAPRRRSKLADVQSLHPTW